MHPLPLPPLSPSNSPSLTMNCISATLAQHNHYILQAITLLLYVITDLWSVTYQFQWTLPSTWWYHSLQIASQTTPLHFLSLHSPYILWFVTLLLHLMPHYRSVLFNLSAGSTRTSLLLSLAIPRYIIYPYSVTRLLFLDCLSLKMEVPWSSSTSVTI